MPTFKVDFSDAPPIKEPEAGEYVVIVRTAELGTSKSGNTKLTLRMEITEAMDDANEEFVGQSIFDHPVTEGRGAWKMRPICEAFLGGIPGPDEEIDVVDFIEESALVTVVREMWKEEDGGDGKTHAKVSKYQKMPTSGVY